MHQKIQPNYQVKSKKIKNARFSKNPKSQLFLPFLLIITLSVFLFINPVSADKGPTTIFAAYMIGSDLEYNTEEIFEENIFQNAAASNDIIEMASGYPISDLNNDLEIVVGYGGSEKKGWNGLTIATIEDILNDLDDGVIGNTNDAYKQRLDLDICSADGLSTFLRYIQENYPDSRLILILWDHGNAYHGMGPNTYQKTYFNVPNLHSGLANYHEKIDLIGFDACYMANLEVMNQISEFAYYYVGSEDTEPSHGWDYKSIISALAENPEISSKNLGVLIIDSYMDNPEHSHGELALSLIDLTMIDEVLFSLDQFSLKLFQLSRNDSNLAGISRAIGKTSGIGISKDSQGIDKEKMIDISSFAGQARENIPLITNEATFLEDTLKKCIVYARQDTPLTQIRGIGIFSPRMATDPNYSDYLTIDTIFGLSSEWVGFLQSYRTMIESIQKIPEVVQVEEGYKIISDGFIRVTCQYLQITIDGSQIVLAEEPVSSNNNGLYLLPEWSGEMTYLSNGSTTSILPMYYVETSDEDVELYYAWGVLTHGGRQKYVRMDLWYDVTEMDLTWKVRPYIIKSDGEQEFERSSSISIGDQLDIYAVIRNMEGDPGWRKVGSIVWNKYTTIIKKQLPCDKYATQLVATDFGDNSGYSDLNRLYLPDWGISCIIN